MVTKKSKHYCTKETEIALLKQHQEYFNRKIDEIHRVMVGNGRMGLKDEMNQIKGGLKYTQIILSVLLGLLSLLMLVVR